jgi:xylan 1,4-beta-xylosidase
MIIRNPVLPGFYPDPSVIRVGGDYYMATSTFEYFPGVPIFHSTDLVNWRQIGHALTRESQVNLTARKSSEGIYAPTLRHHNGIFYMITTDVYGIGNFYVTAADPAGPWSDPVRVPYGNIDPSLFFDDDGRAYVTAQSGFDTTSHIIQYEIDITTGRALSEPAAVFHGDEGPWVEGPHLYKIRGLYYMMAASGGTGPKHREIIGRSASPYGPFELLSHPILTHKDLPDHPVQYTGHAELVEDTEGSWWAFFLGVRLTRGGFSVMGRETFLAPVQWTEDGWPMIDNNEGHATLFIDTAGDGIKSNEPAPAAGNAGKEVFRYRTDFPEDALDMSWCYTRVLPQPEAVSLIRRPGWLALTGNPSTLRDGGCSLFVCRRQQHAAMRVETVMDFQPEQAGEEAGLAARLSDTTYYAIGVRLHNGLRYVSAGGFKKGEAFRLEEHPSGSGLVWLAIEADEHSYTLLYSLDGSRWISLGSEPASAIAPESEGAFTGVTLGLYAWGGSLDTAPPAAYYKHLAYTGDDRN